MSLFKKYCPEVVQTAREVVQANPAGLRGLRITTEADKRQMRQEASHFDVDAYIEQQRTLKKIDEENKARVAQGLPPFKF